jgi:hypothetical protein
VRPSRLALALALAGCAQRPLGGADARAPTSDRTTTDVVALQGLDATPGIDRSPSDDLPGALDAGAALADVGCGHTAVVVDSNNVPRDALGRVRECWPGELRCACDTDGDCYARPGYVACDYGADAPPADARRYVPPPDPTDGGACPAGQMRCPYTAFLDEPPSFARCQPAPLGRCPVPDIVIRRDWIADDTDEPTPNRLYLETLTFLSSSAEVTERCVRGPGRRRVLRFNFAALNLGDGPFRVGRPDENDRVHWENFTAHGHFHIRGWGDYSLRTIEGAMVVSGRKQSFCLEDNIRDGDADPSQRVFEPPRCANFSFDWEFHERPEFGLSPMWGDEYPSNVPCQWIDLGPEAPTASDRVADGIYRLALAVNVGDNSPQPLYREGNYDNNRVEIRVEIRPTSARACADTAGDLCPGGARRSCEGACP